VTTAAGEASVAGLTVAPTGGVALGKKVGFFAVMQLPLIPQHHQRKPKNNPKYGAANIVHGVSAIEGNVDERVVVTLCGLGTGS